MTGDGVLATLPTASAAFDAAQAIQREVGEHHLDVRAGIHVGEIDIRDGDVSGLAVNLAARVMNHARAGQILVSSTAAEAALGRGHVTKPVGTHELKGIDGAWMLHELV